MAKKKATMQDIADLCGVSVATVSYVINNSEKEHIKHDTRIKVLEAAKKLNYAPNVNRYLTHSKSNLIGIIINWNKRNAPSKKMLYYDLAIELQMQLALLGYDTIIATTKALEEEADIISKRSLDAAFIIDIRSEEVRRVTSKYYVPIIFLDCEINDPLFCKIYPDYEYIISKAKRMLQSEDIFLVMEDILNEELKDIITNTIHPDNIFVNDMKNDLRKFLLQHQNKKGIILGEILGLEVERYIRNDHIVVVTSLDKSKLLLPDTMTIPIKNKTKAITAVKTLEQLLRLTYVATPCNQHLLKPDEE
ncbi:LacI family DNA-binding transcriptional regulator [Anaeromicropila herbilytica]|uniref:Putative transcription regulator (LacI family) n=1 Tax=Anaeromicropila herbilytica TaxID=2785025 RepID=A0A7R7EPY0_9FIRM|nr:LacI family DNA-binding transcriptional regulator [Anaeromicropila herbilytica]BCN32641.1 putative transcription regulator (LacI family) [Anaeromicropila herbilytica]